MSSIVPALTLDGLAAAPWALERAVLAELVSYAQRGEAFTAAARPPSARQSAGAAAIIPIHGVIERRSSFLLDLFGGTSVEDIRAQLRAAVANQQIGSIILDIDSPGGGVQGITELAQEIRAARGVKRVVAVMETGASAAYWLGAQADHILIVPSGQAGSIGIYAVHVDISRALDAQGVTPTIISAGERKTEGNEFEPLTDEARAEMQRRADTFYGQFVSDVAKGRGVSAEQVREGYGKGAVLLAKEALAAGMVDGIGTLDDALRMTARTPSPAPRAEDGTPDPSEVELPFRSRLTAAVEEIEHLAEHATVRAALRAKEGRPAFSEPTEAALRSIRDGISALLPVEPVAAAASTPEPVQPAPVVAPPTPAPQPVTSRFRSPEEWEHYLWEITH